MTRLLLGQLGANGDCLYATILARQIRHDFPGAHITWAISSQCVDVLRNNPFVDEIWVVPIPGWTEHATAWCAFEREAVRRLMRHDFDHAFLSQIWPNNFQNFDGTIRPSILRSYGRPITVPIENIVYLTDGEIERANAFAKTSGMMSFEHRILFECSSKSGQSFVTPELAQDVADLVYQALPDATIVFSTNVPMTLRHANSRYAGALSLRESAQLTRQCSLFVGCGSGGTVAATSTAGAGVPMIQLLMARTSMFASFAHDFEHFGLPSDHILEMSDERPARIADCIVTACREGIGSAQAQFGSRIPLHFDHYFLLTDWNLFAQKRYLDAAVSLTATAERYGWRPELIAFGRD